MAHPKHMFIPPHSVSGEHCADSRWDHTDSCVEEFYDRLMEDSELDSVFDGVDDVALKESRFNLMRVAFAEELPNEGQIADVGA
eukprot:1284554-Rhodomonas_salina.1